MTQPVCELNPLVTLESPDELSARAPGAARAQDYIRGHGVLCFGGEDWWYHNRGHCDMQYMRQYSRYGTVLYINSVVMRKPNIAEGRMFLRRVARKLRSMRRGLVEVAPQWSVYSPVALPVHHLPGLRWANERALRMQVNTARRKLGLRRPLVWVNCPTAAPTALALPRAALVYQRTDRYEDYPGVDRDRVRTCDHLLKQNADLTFYSNAELWQQEQSECRRAIHQDHGVDFELFARAALDPRVPAEMQPLRRPIAGFYGGIDAHTFDLGLMAAVVARLPEVTFVFIGQSSQDLTSLTRHANVVRIPQQCYEEIPHFGKCFDVALMPWNRNRWIQACSPIKLREYLALGKPVVSTPLSGLGPCAELIRFADNADDFAAQVRAAARELDPHAAARRRAQVESDDWARRAEALIDALRVAQCEARNA